MLHGFVVSVARFLSKSQLQAAGILFQELIMWNLEWLRDVGM